MGIKHGAEPGSLIAALQRAEKALPDLLERDEAWTSLDVNYEPPRVERLWRSFEDDFRIYLHRIHPCDTALFHPHPWPSAVRIITGKYEMDVGYSGDAENKDGPPPVAAHLCLTAGSHYEMVHADGWHSVRPIVIPSLSVMVTGKPWPVRRWSPSPDFKLGPLGRKDFDGLLNDFRSYYWGR